MGQHLRKRIPQVLAADTGDADQLLTTRELAAWLQVSIPWVEIGRSKGYGPPYEKLSPSIVRYRRGKVRAWLDERSHACTAEYAKQRGKAA